MPKPYKLRKQIIIPPPEGWENNCYYVIEVSYKTHNPVHRAIFHLNNVYNGHPNGWIWADGYEDKRGSASPYYMKYINKIDFGRSDGRLPDEPQRT